MQTPLQFNAPPQDAQGRRPVPPSLLAALDAAKVQDSETLVGQAVPEGFGAPRAAPVSAADTPVFETPSTIYESPEELALRRERETVEARCSPMRFEDLVTTGKVQQKVPILPGRFEVVFCGVNALEETFCVDQALLVARAPQTYAKTYLLMEIACGTVSLNGQLLPSMLNDKGERDSELFTKRWKKVGDLDTSLLKKLHQHYLWFLERKDRLVVLDDLKNG